MTKRETILKIISIISCFGEIEKTYIPISGGTLNGALNTQNILPKTNRAYDLGSSTKVYNNVYADWLVQRQPIRKGSTTYTSNGFGFAWTGDALRVAINGDDGDDRYLVHSMKNAMNLYWNGSKLELWINGTFVGYIAIYS